MKFVDITVKDHGFFQRAVALAENGEHRVRVGCIAVAHSKQIAGAYNTYRNNPANTSFGNATHHAEFNVVRLISDRLLPITTLYIARISQAGIPAPSRPCDRCWSHLKHKYRINEVVYLNRNGHLVKERPR